MREWETLQEYVEKQYGLDGDRYDWYDSYRVANVLSDDVASGFGVRKVARVERDENEVKVHVYASEFAAVPDVEGNATYPGRIVTYPNLLNYGFNVEPGHAWGGWGYSFDFVNYLYFVRCIKN